MYFKKKGPPALDAEKLKKGQILIVKVPPFYDKEYFYEIIGAGGKLVRAKLFHSPTVKKQWTFEDLELLAQTGMVRFATDEDLSRHQASLQANAQYEDAEVEDAEISEDGSLP